MCIYIYVYNCIHIYLFMWILREVVLFPTQPQRPTKFIPGATWEPWRIPPAICVTTLGGRLHVTTCTWDRKLTVKCWMAVNCQTFWWPKNGRFLGQQRFWRRYSWSWIKLEEHFMVCVSYKWYQCHSNDFNLFLRLSLGDVSVSVSTLFSISLLSFL